ncbi:MULTISPECIES: hypothetical protein [unclassified Arthrobacter]|uniref:hypothetical protein n=1 Tax=unclassified Arthrobacter TaxID=235627 RepID=UPI00339939D4
MRTTTPKPGNARRRTGEAIIFAVNRSAADALTPDAVVEGLSSALVHDPVGGVLSLP